MSDKNQQEAGTPSSQDSDGHEELSVSGMNGLRVEVDEETGHTEDFSYEKVDESNDES